MNIGKFSDEIIHDNDAMWQLGNFVVIKLEHLQEQISEAIEEKYLIRDSKMYNHDSSRYKKELKEMKIQLEFIKNIIKMSEKSHKYLED